MAKNSKNAEICSSCIGSNSMGSIIIKIIVNITECVVCCWFGDLFFSFYFVFWLELEKNIFSENMQCITTNVTELNVFKHSRYFPHPRK